MGYIAARAVTLVAGAPKVGKSTAVFALMCALTSGGTFLGQVTRQARRRRIRSGSSTAGAGTS